MMDILDEKNKIKEELKKLDYTISNLKSDLSFRLKDREELVNELKRLNAIKCCYKCKKCLLGVENYPYCAKYKKVVDLYQPCLILTKMRGDKND